jgi:hypothetical protein
VVYGVTMLLLSLSFAGIRDYIQRRDDLTRRYPSRTARGSRADGDTASPK